MDVETKIKQDIRDLGCKSDKHITLTYYLYMYLVDERIMYDIEYCYNKDIDTVYVVARPGKDKDLNIYVPLATSDKLSIEDIHNMQENLCTVETGPVINIAFIEGDLTITIYTFTKGRNIRPQPVKITEVQAKEERRSYINNELKKKQQEILDTALNGGSVDDDDCEMVE